MGKPKTKAQQDRAADLRLLKTYNISLKDYEKLLKDGEGGCWICGRLPLGERRLHVDHDHSWKKSKIVSVKHNALGVWDVQAEYNGDIFGSVSTKKSLAIQSVKRQLLRASVRGLLCYQHNAGLQKFSDNPMWLDGAAKYLRQFSTGSPLSGQEAKHVAV